MMGYQEAAMRLLWAWAQSLSAPGAPVTLGVKRVLRRLARDWARPGQEDDLLHEIAGRLQINLQESELDDIVAECDTAIGMARAGRETDAIAALAQRLKTVSELYASGDLTMDDALHASYVIGHARGEVDQIRERSL